MQGQQSSLQSLTEGFEFDHGASTSNSSTNHSLFWNNLVGSVDMQNSPDYTLSSVNDSVAYPNSLSHSNDNVAWSFSGLISSDPSRQQISADEAVVEHGWVDALAAHARPNLRLEDTELELSNALPLESANMDLSANPVAERSWFPQNFSDIAPSTNAEFIGNGGQPHLYKADESPNLHVQPVGSNSADYGPSSRATIDYLSEIGESRIGAPLDGRRPSCKRKTAEGVSGQSSLDGSSSISQAESSAWHSVPARRSSGNSLTIPGRSVEHNSAIWPNELLSQRPGGSTVSLPATPEAHPSNISLPENSQRNYRVRIGPAQQRGPTPCTSLRTLGNGSSSRRSIAWSANQLPHRVVPAYLPTEARPGTALTGPSTSASDSLQNLHNPSYPSTAHSSHFRVIRNPRIGSASNSPTVTGRRLLATGEVLTGSTLPRVAEQSVYLPVPDVRQQVPRNGLAPAAAAISSQGGSYSGATQPATGLHWGSLQAIPANQSRRSFEIVRRSLFPSVSGSNVQNGGLSLVRPTVPGSQEMAPPQNPPQQVGHSCLRSAFWVDREGDGVLGIPLSLRSLAAASGGRRQLASEDVVILYHSVLSGLADIHDRHRDLRLDVDNMSYEELLALEERIGNVNTGLSEEKILKSLKQLIYLSSAEDSQDNEPCCICQEKYLSGDQLGKLDCGHDFHTDCIKQWLLLKNLCPICKMTALAM